MSPVSHSKPKQFAFTLDHEEFEMLEQLAESEGRSKANWIRWHIRSSFEELNKRRK